MQIVATIPEKKEEKNYSKSFFLLLSFVTLHLSPMPTATAIEPTPPNSLYHIKTISGYFFQRFLSSNCVYTLQLIILACRGLFLVIKKSNKSELNFRDIGIGYEFQKLPFAAPDAHFQKLKIKKEFKTILIYV